MIFSIKPQIFELKCVFSYFRLKTHITLLLPVYVYSWEQRKVSELFKVTRGYVLAATLTEPAKTDEMPYPVYSSQTKDNGLMGYYKDYLYEDAITWTTDGANAGTVNYRAGKFYCTNVCGVLLSNEVTANQMIAEALNNVAKGYVSYVGNPKLMNNVMADIEIMIPTHAEEREKLSVFFRNLDNLITLHQRKCQIDGCRFQSPLAITWEQRKLSEIATMHARIGWQNLRTSEFLDSGDYMLITGTDFIDGAVNFDTCHYVERERYEQDKHIQIRNGSILITKDGTLGKVAYIQGLTMPATLNAGVFNVEIKDENEVDNRYLFQYLKAPFLMDYVDKKATGGTIKHLNQNILVDFPVVLPHKAEQEKIGEYFLAIDHLITLHQREFAFLCKEKSKKFRYIKNAWEQRKFSDLVQIERGGSPRPIDDFITDSPDGLNWVKIGDAPAQGNYITKTAEKIKPEGLSKTREVHPGDLILSNSMSFGKPYIMGIDGCIHDGWLLIRNTYKVFDLTFLCHLLGTPQMIIQYKSLAAGSTVNNLNKELVGNTVVTIPTIKEQRVLGQYLETLDNLITLHQRKPNFYAGGYYAE